MSQMLRRKLVQELQEARRSQRNHTLPPRSVEIPPACCASRVRHLNFGASENIEQEWQYLCRTEANFKQSNTPKRKKNSGMQCDENS
jgi:hypothetical protein